MVNQQLIDWIKSQEARGYSDQQLFNYLIQQGHNPNEINEAIKFTKQPSQFTNQSLKKPINIFPIIIIGVIVVALIGGGIFYFTFQNKKADSEIIHKSVESTDDLTDTDGNKIGEMNAKIEADIEVTTDCGGMDCFEKKFSECKPATVTSKLIENLVYFYEIIGPKDGLCEVKSKFTANPNPEWVNKEMICKYDNIKDFENAVKDMNNCQGELYSLMTGTLSNINPSLDIQTDFKCPDGTTQEATWSSGEPMCIAKPSIIPDCEECKSGKKRSRVEFEGTEGKLIFYDCYSEFDCISGYICKDEACVIE